MGTRHGPETDVDLSMDDVATGTSKLSRYKGWNYLNLDNRRDMGNSAALITQLSSVSQPTPYMALPGIYSNTRVYVDLLLDLSHNLNENYSGKAVGEYPLYPFGPKNWNRMRSLIGYPMDPRGVPPDAREAIVGLRALLEEKGMKEKASALGRIKQRLTPEGRATFETVFSVLVNETGLNPRACAFDEFSSTGLSTNTSDVGCKEAILQMWEEDGKPAMELMVARRCREAHQSYGLVIFHTVGERQQADTFGKFRTVQDWRGSWVEASKKLDLGKLLKFFKGDQDTARLALGTLEAARSRKISVTGAVGMRPLSPYSTAKQAAIKTAYPKSFGAENEYTLEELLNEMVFETDDDVNVDIVDAENHDTFMPLEMPDMLDEAISKDGFGALATLSQWGHHAGQLLQNDYHGEGGTRVIGDPYRPFDLPMIYPNNSGHPLTSLLALLAMVGYIVENWRVKKMIWTREGMTEEDRREEFRRALKHEHPKCRMKVVGDNAAATNILPYEAEYGVVEATHTLFGYVVGKDVNGKFVVTMNPETYLTNVVFPARDRMDAASGDITRGWHTREEDYASCKMIENLRAEFFASFRRATGFTWLDWIEAHKGPDPPEGKLKPENLDEALLMKNRNYYFYRVNPANIREAFLKQLFPATMAKDRAERMLELSLGWPSVPVVDATRLHT